MSYNKFIIIFLFISKILFSQIEVSIPDTTGKEGQSIAIPIYVSNLSGKRISSYYFELRYNKNILKAKSIITDGTLTGARGWDVSGGFTAEGIYIKSSGFRYLSGEGKLIIIKFEVIADEGYTDLVLKPFYFNYGSFKIKVTNGSFRVYSKVKINFTSLGNGEGAIYLNGNRLELPSTKELIVGNSYILKAKPRDNSNFTEWRGDIYSTYPEIEFIVKEPATFSAVFTLKQFTVTASIKPQGFGSVNGEGVYNYNDVVTLEAVPYSGMEFESWIIDGNEVSNEPIYKFNIKKDINANANFYQVLFHINANALPLEGGQVTGNGYYYIEEEAELVATSNEGWTFVNWSENGNIISEDSTIVISVNEDRDLIANFEIITNVHNPAENEYFIDTPYPNPFNPKSNFRFGIVEKSNVSLKIYDVNGREVSELINQSYNRGVYIKQFDASDLSSGLYFYKYVIQNKLTKKIRRKSGKLLLIK